MCDQLSTVAASVVIAIDTGIGFDDAGNLCHYITGSPWRPTLIDIGLLSVPFRIGSNLIQRLCLSTDDRTLLNITCQPRVEITVFQLLLCLYLRNGSQQNE